MLNDPHNWAPLTESNSSTYFEAELSDTPLYMLFAQAANMMRCEKCGGKHRRFPVDRAWYDARFCDKCNTRHSAKEVGFVFWKLFFCVYADNVTIFVEPLVLSVSDFGWLYPWVLKPVWMHHRLCSLALAYDGPSDGPVQCHFWGSWQIRTHYLVAQSLTLYRLSYPDRGKFLTFSIRTSRRGKNCILRLWKRSKNV